MSQEFGPERPKPCPFCGSVGIDILEGSTFRWMEARCIECGATCGEVRVQTTGEASPEERLEKAMRAALHAWNTRAED